MKILVDADAGPIKEAIVRLAKKYGIQALLQHLSGGFVVAVQRPKNVKAFPASPYLLRTGIGFTFPDLTHQPLSYEERGAEEGWKK